MKNLVRFGSIKPCFIFFHKEPGGDPRPEWEPPNKKPLALLKLDMVSELDQGPLREEIDYLRKFLRDEVSCSLLAEGPDSVVGEVKEFIIEYLAASSEMTIFKSIESAKTLFEETRSQFFFEGDGLDVRECFFFAWLRVVKP